MKKQQPAWIRYALIFAAVIIALGAVVALNRMNESATNKTTEQIPDDDDAPAHGSAGAAHR